MKLGSQDGDNMLSAVTLTHIGQKEEIRALLSAKGQSVLCTLCPRHSGWSPTSSQSPCHMPGSPGVVAAQPDQQALPTACLPEVIFKRNRKHSSWALDHSSRSAHGVQQRRRAVVNTEGPHSRKAQMTAKGSRAVVIRSVYV